MKLIGSTRIVAVYRITLPREEAPTSIYPLKRAYATACSLNHDQTESDQRVENMEDVKETDFVSFVPIRRWYASTIAKVQGQTLDHVTIWFDMMTLPYGCAYVAISRVRSLNNLWFLTRPLTTHFKVVPFVL